MLGGFFLRFPGSKRSSQVRKIPQLVAERVASHSNIGLESYSTQTIQYFIRAHYYVCGVGICVLMSVRVYV